MIIRIPKPKDVERRVNELLHQRDDMKELGARVIPGTAHHESWGWTISVGTEREPAKTYQFIDGLVEISEQLQKTEHWDVVVAPSGVRPSKVK